MGLISATTNTFDAWHLTCQSNILPAMVSFPVSSSCLARLHPSDRCPETRPIRKTAVLNLCLGSFQEAEVWPPEDFPMTKNFPKSVASRILIHTAILIHKPLGKERPYSKGFYNPDHLRPIVRIQSCFTMFQI